MKLTIGFSKPKNNKFPIFSWLIRLCQKTNYSHVYVKWYSSGIDVNVLYEAGGTSVKFIGEKIYSKKIQPVHEYEVNIDKVTYKKLLHFCMSNAGVHYGIKQIIGIVLVEVFGLSKNPYSDGRNSQVCSELVGYILEDVLGKDLNLDLDIAGPKAIKEYLDKQKDFNKVL